jgi:hypothetical protein
METMAGAGIPSQSPENMPEVPREVNIIRGAALNVQQRARELSEQLGPITRQYPESVSDQVKPIGENDNFPVNSPLGQELRLIYKELQETEDILSRAIHRLAV